MSYANLDDEAKIALAIEFVAMKQPLPEELRKFLAEQRLLKAIVNPGVIEEESYDYQSRDNPQDH